MIQSGSSDPQNELSVTVTVPTLTKPPTQPAVKTISASFSMPSIPAGIASHLNGGDMASDSAEESNSAYPTAVLAAETGPSDVPSRTISRFGAFRNNLPVTLSLIAGISIIGCGILAVLTRRRFGREAE